MMSSAKKITLKSSDGVSFEVEETVVLESQTIKHVVEDCADAERGIPLPNVTSKILLKVIEYWKKHVEAKSGDKKDDKSTEDDLKIWDADFVKVNQNILFDLILAVDYLNIKSLLDLTCQTVADMIKGKTSEEFRKFLNFKITLKSSDGETFKVKETVALESQTIKHMVEVLVDDRADTVIAGFVKVDQNALFDLILIIKHDTEIPLPVTSKILLKVIEYCKKHVEARSGDKKDDKSTEDDLKTWDAHFVKVNQNILFDLILAANYLDIKSLLDLTTQTAADMITDMIKGKTPEEIRKTFNIEKMSPDDEEELRREHQWAFE